MVSRPVRLALVNSRELLRQGLAALLTNAGHVVVALAGDAESALEQLPTVGAQLLISSMRLPGADGAALAKAAAGLTPPVPTLILTGSRRDIDVADAVRAGVAGYLSNQVSVDELLSAIEAIADGHRLIGTRAAAGLRRGAGAELPGMLTPRERQVLALAAEGLTNKAIAERLTLTENTVKNHVRHVREKLGVHSRAEAIVVALRAQQIDLP